jgi:hypothetical protein
MLADLPKRANIVIVLALIGASILPPDVCAQNHVISPQQLQQQTLVATSDRQAKIDRVQQFFGTNTAQKTLRSAKIDYRKVQQAVPQLSDTELAQLAAKTDKAQQDFAAGDLNNRQITYILIALATAVIVILVMKA